MRPGRRGAAALGIALLLVAALALALPGRAEAHALLVRSDPPINGALRESPTEVRLFMSEPLQRDFSDASVLNSQGRRVDFGEVGFDDFDPTAMSIPVPRLQPGIYTVAWRTLSLVDGHTWNGSFSFTVLNPDGSAPLGTAFTPSVGTSGPSAGWDAAVKWLSLVSVLALAGASLFALLVGGPAARRLHGQGVATAAAFGRRAEADALGVARVAVVLLFLGVGYDAASAAAKLGGLHFLDEILFDTRTGLWLLVRWAMLLVATLVLVAARRGRPRDARVSNRALVVVAAGLIASLASVSHGAAIDEGWIWATLFDALHAAAAALWLGMLAALVWALWRGRAEGAPRERRALQIDVVRRFSLIAGGTVPVLVVAGLLSLLVQTPAWRGFTDTDWGLAMLVKLAILALLFAVAATNALLLRPRSQAAGPGASPASTLERRFRDMMRLEVGLALAVLAATAALTQLPSPRSELPATEQKQRTIERTFAIDDLEATLRIEPNLVGINRFDLGLTDAAGGPPADPVTEVRLQFRYLDDPAVGLLVVPAEADGAGRWTLEGAFFGLQGEWAVDVEVRRRAADDAIAGLTTTVEQGYLTVLPFGVEPPGALALPISQFDWNGVGALWAALVAGMCIAYRGTLRRGLPRRVADRAGDLALVGGAAFMATAIILLFSVEAAPGRTLDNPVPRSPESVAAGATLFAANCASCHGESGRGDGPLAGTLPQPPANFRVHVPFHPDGTLYTWITEGIVGTAMLGFGEQLGDQERWDLVNFLRENFDRPLDRPDDG
jgi:copper transport protein